MQAQRENPPSFTDCKDKFLVQSCIVSGDLKDASSDVFEKAGGSGGEVKQTKLRVVLMSPPKPPSPVPEGDEENDHSNPSNAIDHPSNALAAREGNAAELGGACSFLALSSSLFRWDGEVCERLVGRQRSVHARLLADGKLCCCCRRGSCSKEV